MKVLHWLCAVGLLTAITSAHAQWRWQNPLPQGNHLSGVTFADGNNGWAVGDYGSIVHTTDGGSAWMPHGIATEADFFGVVFVGADHGWVVGWFGTILHYEGTSPVGGWERISPVTEHYLEPNYPNPFNPATTFVFGVPRTSAVTITAYDVLGRHVTTLLSGRVQAGRHQVVWNCQGCASGVYLVAMSGDGFRVVRKATLLR
jgi:hypothetical protein